MLKEEFFIFISNADVLTKKFKIVDQVTRGLEQMLINNPDDSIISNSLEKSINERKAINRIIKKYVNVTKI